MTLTKDLAADTDEGIYQIADTIKTLLYSEIPHIFENVDFNNDLFFLEPLFFAYFNRGKLTFDIKNLLLGRQYNKSSEPSAEIPTCNGIGYLPDRGYFHTKSDSSLDFSESCLRLSNGLEVMRHQHLLLKDRFVRSTNDRVVVEVTETTKKHFSALQGAFLVIEHYLPALHEELLKTNRRLVLFENQEVPCFATIEVFGMVFLSTIPENGAVFFLEEIIHQGSHNTFNAIIFDRNEFFKIDIEQANLGDHIGNKFETRSIFSALHGLYTVAKRYEAFYELYKQNVFIGEERHEFLGRLADLKKRFRTGLERLNHSEVFTDKGLLLYNMLDSYCRVTIEKLSELDGHFNLSNQPSEFSYRKFYELNPLSPSTIL